MHNERTADILTFIMIGLLLLVTCFVAQERGLEASSFHAKIESLEMQLANLKPAPRITVQRASIYPLSGEVTVEEVKK